MRKALHTMRRAAKTPRLPDVSLSVRNRRSAPRVCSSEKEGKASRLRRIPAAESSSPHRRLLDRQGQDPVPLVK